MRISIQSEPALRLVGPLGFGSATCCAGAAGVCKAGVGMEEDATARGGAFGAAGEDLAFFAGGCIGDDADRYAGGSCESTCMAAAGAAAAEVAATDEEVDPSDCC
tara:strand:- start:66 stop:380 length:315 start_codon:yes stop_codon:yes gene_type:complete